MKKHIQKKHLHSDNLHLSRPAHLLILHDAHRGRMGAGLMLSDFPRYFRKYTIKGASSIEKIVKKLWSGSENPSKSGYIF